MVQLEELNLKNLLNLVMVLVEEEQLLLKLELKDFLETLE